jgi:apolipoprotein N-acyltransferase
VKACVFWPAILSGILLWTAFFPLAWGWMSFFALAPFLTLVRAEGISRGRRYFAAFLGGFTFFLLAVSWVRVAHPMMMYFAWPAIAVAGAFFWVAALAIMRKLDELKLPLTVTFTVTWVGLEYARTHFPCGYSFLAYIGLQQSSGFGWYSLGYAMHQYIAMIQAADLGGVYFISVAVAVMNGATYEWLVRSNWIRKLLCWPYRKPDGGAFRELWTLAICLAFPAFVLCYGLNQMVHPPFERGPIVASIQGNLGQDDKNQRGDQAPKEGPIPLEKEYFGLAHRATRGDGKLGNPDLVIWPETCYPDDWDQMAPELPEGPERRQMEWGANKLQQDFLNRWKAEFPPTSMLLGLNRREWLTPEKARRYNSAVLVLADGTFAGSYDKIHLVPFGEYVPFKKQAPWLQMFTPYDFDYSCTPGERWTHFELPAAPRENEISTIPKRTKYKFGLLICYEDSDPYMARQYNRLGRHGGGIDFLVNISNDGWFKGSQEHDEHLAICRFRAVEARKPIIRAVNMGISAAIDSEGRVIALPGETWETSKKVAAVVRAELPLDQRDSFYALLGDWVPALCWILIGSWRYAIWRKNRRTKVT